MVVVAVIVVVTADVPVAVHMRRFRRWFDGSLGGSLLECLTGRGGGGDGNKAGEKADGELHGR